MLTVRPADHTDLDPLYQFSRSLIEQYEDMESVDMPVILSWLRNKLEQQLPEYRAVFQNDKKVGYFRLSETDDSDLEIDDLYVFPAYRNQGIGTEIIRRCISESERLEKPLMLYVFTSNTRAIALYERLGFAHKQTVSPTRIILHRLPKP